MIRLDDARVVITGAGGGVGSVLVETFAAAGARVVACDLPAVRLDHPAIVERHAFDICDRVAVAQGAAAILAGGAPAAVISNAGWTRAETMADVTPEALRAEMDLNFTGAADFTLALLPGLRGRAEGAALVFIASVNALAHHGNPSYSSAKAALLAWMRAIAVEEGRHGIRANAVVPGSIRTPAWDQRLKFDPDVLDRVSRLYPLGRIVTPAEVANAALFLASALDSGITGAALAVDAGLSAGNLPFLDAIT